MGPSDKTDPGYPNRTTDVDPKYEPSDEPSAPDADYDNGSGVWSSDD